MICRYILYSCSGVGKQPFSCIVFCEISFVEILYLSWRKRTVVDAWFIKRSREIMIYRTSVIVILTSLSKVYTFFADSSTPSRKCKSILSDISTIYICLSCTSFEGDGKIVPLIVTIIFCSIVNIEIFSNSTLFGICPKLECSISDLWKEFKSICSSTSESKTNKTYFINGCFDPPWYRSSFRSIEICTYIIITTIKLIRSSSFSISCPCYSSIPTSIISILWKIQNISITFS